MKILMTMLLCGCCASALANEPVGLVTKVEGIADVLSSAGQLITLREGQQIELKDRIRTKSYSKVIITLNDESVLKLAASSCVTIEEFSMASGVRKSCLILLTRGKAEAKVAKTGAPETFVIKTPNARGAVKGSDIFVSYIAGTTGMFVDKGAMSVVNPAFPNVERMLNPGACVFIPQDSPPEETRQTMKAEMSMHKREVEPQLVRKWVPSEDSSVMSAVVTVFSGTVRIHKKLADDWSEVKIGDKLDQADKLQTGEDGSAEIKLSNANTLFIKSSTELIFNSLRYDKASGNYHNQLEVIQGEVLAVVEKIQGESTFEVRTPTAVSGVRGTIMRVVVWPPQAGISAQTQVFFEGGRGDVVSLQTGAMQQLLPGQNVQVDAGGVISQPIVTSNEERSSMLQELSQEQLNIHFEPVKEPLGEDFVNMPPPPGGKEGLPPPPPPPGVENMPPPPPPYDQLNPEIWYRAPLHLQSFIATGSISTTPYDIKEIALEKNGAWHSTFHGQFSTSSPGWSIELNNAAGDRIFFSGLPGIVNNPQQQQQILASSVVSFTGQVKGPAVDRTLSLNEVKVTTIDASLAIDATGTFVPLQ